MAKQLNVNLSFNADTSQAKAQIQALSKSLQEIAKMPGNASNLFDDTQIKKASQAALELQQHLSKAVNVDTGKLDLSRFSSSLKTSNKDLSVYCNTLLSTGEKGQQAFLQLAQAIATADTPVTRVNKKLAEMGTTLKNTARWQISSSILHGFMGAVQSAYGYAQDLNESLNEIRIVTGQNIEQMSKFAAEANRAAKALSTTTTEYTDASLIYYQQGLSDSEVAKRTEVTIKMANAAGQSAQVVSDQLTAIWNNFYDGSKSLEYYADVMTALGAATASSTDEIAGGLEKFAAIGETIGLSYEYAASALATITSNTRQSEEVVGTALKTIFARIQGLNLGETLDDGTTLNKYSKALQSVGISIFDQAGELKNMDNILNEMADKWDTLSKAQQAALAQTVAGTRQYTQLVALMDNWDNGDNDSMTANLDTAYGSTGALQEQADIYAESWEAAQDRVTAAAEHIYSSLINDEFFIDLLNGFEKVLETVGGLIDGLGGLKGVIGIVGSVFLTSFAKQMPEALTNLRQNFMVFIGQSKKVMQEVQSELDVKLAEQQADPALSESYKIQLEGISKVNAMKQKLVLASKDLSNQERAEYEAKIKNVQAMYEEAAALAEKKKAAEELAATTMKTASGSATRASTGIFDNYASQQDKIGTLEEKATDPDASSEATNTYAQALETARQKAVELELQIEEVKKAYSLTADEVDVLIGTNTDQSLLAETQKKIADKVKETTKSFTDQIKQRSNLENISTSVKSQATAWQNVAKEIKKAQAAGNTKNLSKHVDETKQKMQQYLGVLQKLAQENGIKLSESMIKSMSDTINGMDINNIEEVTQRFSNFAQVISGKANAAITTLDSSIEDLRGDMSTMQFNENEIKEMEQAAEGAATANQELSDSMTNIGGAADENVQGTFKMSIALTEFASTAMSVSALITSMQSAIAVFGDEGATGFEKLGAAISVIMPLMSTFNSLQALSTTLSKSSLVAKLLEAKGYALTTTASGALTIAKTTETGAVVANTAAWYANPIMWIALVIVGVIAALGALLAIILQINTAIKDNSAEGKLEAAKEKAKELNSALESAKKAADDLRSAFDGYDSAVEALDNCVKGTQEWRDALRNVNNEVLALMDKYPSLATMTNDAGEKAIIRGSHGELVVQDWAREELYNKADKAVSNTQNASIHANQDVREAQIVVDKSELKDAIASATRGIATSSTYEYQDRSGAKQSQTYNASSQMRKFIGDNASVLSEMTPDEQKQLLSDFANKNDITTDIDAWVSAIDDLRPQFGELASAIEANTEATKIENEAIAANILANNEGVQDSKWLDEITRIAATDLDKATDAQIQALKDSGWGTTGINKATGVNDEAKKIFAEYAEAAGISNYDLLDTTGTDKNRKFVYNDGNEEITVSLEAMRSVVAAAKANEELAGNANNLVKTLSSKTDEQVSAITAAVTGDKKDLTVGSVRGDFDIESFAKTLTETDLKSMGYEGDLAKMQSDYINAYNKVVEGADEALNGIIDDYIQSVQDQMNSLKDSGTLDELTLAEADALGAALEHAFAVGGSAGMKSVSDMFAKAADQGFGDEFVNALEGIDWSSVSPEELTQHLSDCGVEITYTDEELQTFIETMRKAGEGAQSASEKYKTLHDIINGLETGDTINEEAFKALGPGMDDYFLRMADGTYKLIADADEFYQMVNGQSIEGFKSEISSLQSQNNALSGALDYGVSGLSQNADGSQELASAQLDFLEAFDYNEAQIREWREQLQEGTIDTENLANEINKKIEKLGGALIAEEQLTEKLRTNSEQLKINQEMLASSATSIDELNQMYANAEISAEAYAKALETVAAAEAESYGLDPEKFEDLSEMIEESGSAIAGLSDDLKGNEREANDVAKALLRYDKAVEKVVDKSEDWKKVLTSGNLQDQAEAIEELEEAYANMLDIDIGILSKDFLKNANNLDLMTRAANGSEEAYRELQAIAAKNILSQVKLDTSLFEQDMAWLQGVLFDDVAFPDLEVGASLDNTDFLNSLTEMINRTAMTVDQATAYLASMGVDAEIVEETTTTDDKQEHHGFDSTLQRNVGYARYPIRYGEMTFGTYVAPVVTYDEVITPTVTEETSTKENTAVALKVTSANKSSGGGFKHKNSSHGSGSSKKSSGGGSKSEKTPTPAKKQSVSKTSDVTDRYHTVNEHLDNVSKSMDKAAKAADRLWGKDRLKYLDKQNELLEEEVSLLQAKREEAMAYLTEDTQALRDAARAAGFEVALDEDGVITNYRSIMDTLAAELIAAETRMNEFATQEEQENYEKTILEPLRTKIEELEAAIAIYEETLGIIEDADAEMEDKMDQIMANNFSKIMEGLEIEITINSSDLELLDYYLSKLEDDAYKMAEAGSLMFSPNGNSQLDVYLESLNDYGTALLELEKAYAAGEITQAAYYEGLAEIQSGLMENLESVLELDKAMKEYYGDTIRTAQEEIAKYTDQMEHQNDVLDYYQSLIELSGKSNDYKMIGKILEGQVKTAKNALEISRTWYESAKANAESLALQYEQASSDEEREIIKANWEAAQKAADEAQAQMLSDAEAWAEALKAVLENKLADLGKTLEEALTGGTTFENVATQMDRAVSLQEEYLTTTNQIYETNKLMRTAQQEIDKTTNSAAKKRLQAYIKETQQLQDQSKLSSYELEIQQAKYDLLLAEIALEEAKDSKSTVRLQRDSEGNFGYVYTADSNKIAQAQQELEDAQNSLYNIGLEGANDYAQKYQQTMQEMYDTMADIQQQYLEGAFDSESEYQEAMTAAKEYYYQKLQDYSSLYSVALTTDSRVVSDAWSTDFSSMIYDTEKWMKAVDEYSDKVIIAFREWESAVTGPDGINSIIGSSVEGVGDKVKDVITKTQELTDTLIDEVIPAMDSQIDQVQTLTGAYATLRQNIQEVINTYEAMMRSINTAYSSSSGGSLGGSSSGDNEASNGVGTTTGSSLSGGASSSAGTTSGGSSGNSIQSLSTGDSVTVKTSATNFSRDGGNGTRMKSFVPGGSYSVLSVDGDEILIGKGGVATGWVKKTDLVGFDTGGYTGHWAGSYGKLALLHEKEMVLNRQDTENLLLSMELLNQILEMIDLQSMSAQLGGILTFPGFSNSSMQNLEQNVHIEASFPNVQDKNEIEEAFNNLINKASQYAYRK